MRQILVTNALPYANGHLHIGHVLEHMQTTSGSGSRNSAGGGASSICGDDTHGTAIMIRARQEGIREEELIAAMQQAHVADFAGFDIEFDNYGSTNSPETREFCVEIWAALRKAGLVEERQVTQLYDAAGRHFPGRSLRQGNLPEVQVARPVRRQLRQVRRPLQPHRTDRPGEHAFGQQAGNPPGRSPVREHREAARIPRRVDAKRRASSARDRQLSARAISSASRCTIGTFRGRRRTSASRFPTAPATTGTSGSTRRSATSARRSSGASGTARSSTTGGATTRRQKSTTSSARTSRISTRCSGRPC